MRLLFGTYISLALRLTGSKKFGLITDWCEYREKRGSVVEGFQWRKCCYREEVPHLNISNNEISHYIYKRNFQLPLDFVFFYESSSILFLQNNYLFEYNFTVREKENSTWYEYVKMATLAECDSKAHFSIVTKPRCRRGGYSFPGIVLLCPWSLPYNAEY